MKVLLKGESSRKETITSKTGLVECHHASAHPSLDKGSRFQVKWVIDFSDCPTEQIQRAAAEYCIIAARRDFIKVQKPSDKEWNDITLKAADLIPTPASKLDKAAKAIAGFDDATLEALGLSRIDK